MNKALCHSKCEMEDRWGPLQLVFQARTPPRSKREREWRWLTQSHEGGVVGSRNVPLLETRESGVVVDLRLAFRVRGWGGGRNVPSLEMQEGGMVVDLRLMLLTCGGCGCGESGDAWQCDVMGNQHTQKIHRNQYLLIKFE